MSRFAAVLIAVSLNAGMASADSIKLAVYHTNDVHGWVLARPASCTDKRLVGGAAVLSNYLKQEPAGPRLLLDAGDWFQGTPEGNLSSGTAVAAAFNAAGYDAIEVGNHDFDFGADHLRKLISGFKMPVLGANVRRADTHQRVDWLKPWIIKDIGGVKVGIFGLLTTNMPKLTFVKNFAGLEFRREVDEARDAVAELRAQGATVIIAVTHVGFENPSMGKFEGDQTIAAEVEGIDLIVGGHTHSFVKDPSRDPKHGTLIVQDGTTLNNVGKVVLEIDPATKKVVSSSGRLVELTAAQYGEAPEVLKALAPYREKISAAFDVTLATAAATLTRARDSESTLGDWMADCMREWAKADAAVQNAGGIRADLCSGPVTMRDIFNIMPFDNSVVNLTMDGGLLLETLDHGVDKSKGMIQTSGTSFSYDRDKEDGKRIVDALVGGKPLDPKGAYTVSTSDFLFGGGDGYKTFAQASKKDATGTLLRDVLIWCAKEHPAISPASERRMKPLIDKTR